MSLPPLNSDGELPEGVRYATMDEVLTQFGGSTPQRQAVTARPEEFPAVASGYRAEIVRMQDEVLAYLTRHATTPTPIELPQ